MTGMEILFALGSAAAGWALRHWGILAPSQGAPQPSRVGPATGPVLPGEADLKGLLRSLIAEEVQKGVVYLESRLLPPSPLTVAPQPRATT